MKTIEDRLLALEKVATKDGILALGTPGTMIDRALVDVRLLDKEGVSIPESARFHEDHPGLRRESILVWSLGIGGLQQPKMFFWGYTIEDAIARAEAGVDKAIREHWERNPRHKQRRAR